MTGRMTGLRAVALGLVVATGGLLAAGPIGSPLTAVAGPPYLPDDPGSSGVAGGWAADQWNLAGPAGVRAPEAWANLIAAGAPGGSGVTVAVLDTGVAASPDLAAATLLAGHDFVSGDDDPDDPNGHGTHVASTIAEAADNGLGLAGLAYGARVLPVRVLDSAGEGDAATIAHGVEYAVERGADVINLSLNFVPGTDPERLAVLEQALADAHEAGVLVVVGSGNSGSATVAPPAGGPDVLTVGATTEHGCLAAYSNRGDAVDLVAPGGGTDAYVAGDPRCSPGRPGRRVEQVTRTPAGFGLVGYSGTSMAAPHVSATAALVIASGVVGRDPSPDAVRERLLGTAWDLGAPGRDSLYGWGMVDAGAATDPRVRPAPDAGQ